MDFFERFFIKFTISFQVIYVLHFISCYILHQNLCFFVFTFSIHAFQLFVLLFFVPQQPFAGVGAIFEQVKGMILVELGV